MVEDDRLREAYRELRAHPGEAHVGDEAWERLALDELPRVDREALMDHVVRCAECGEIYRGLQELEREARAFDPSVPRSRSDGRAVRAWYGGLAAAAVLVVALAVSWRAPQPVPDQDVLRSAPVPAPQPVAPTGRVDTPPLRLEWRPFPGADGYRVDMACGDLVWSSGRVPGTSLEWPPTLPREPGTTCHWKIVALAGADRRLPADVASALVTFEIAGR